MRLPLVEAGTFPASTPLGAIIDISLAHLTTDNDPFLFLGDGSVLVGMELADNDGGKGTANSLREPILSAKLERVILFTDAGYPPPGTSHNITAKICISDLMTTVNAIFGQGDESGELTRTLDETRALSFVLVAHSPDEQYRVDELRVRLIEDAPDLGLPCSTIPVELLSFEIE